MHKKTILIIIVLLSTLTAAAQNVTFVSPNFELGVKMHLGLSENDVVPQNRTDTITAIDLSGLEIDDISDVQWLPNIQSLNLRWNEITDISPLTVLDSLRYLDLSNNHLEDIDRLIFTGASRMVLNIAGNHIKDFSMMFNPAVCHFEIFGMEDQKEKDAPYLHISHFYADIDEEDKSILTVRAQTNIENDFTVDCGTMSSKVAADGYLYDVPLSENVEQTTMAVFTDGLQGDTTWVVPQKEFDIRANQTVSFDTQLPETYSIGYANAQVGTVTVEGSTLKYVAPETECNDTVYFSYYDGSRVKGFSRFYLYNEKATGIGNLTAEDARIVLRGNRLTISLPSVKAGEGISVNVVDATGRQLLTHQSVATSGNYYQELVLPVASNNIIIAQVSTSKRRYIRKFLMTN